MTHYFVTSSSVVTTAQPTSNPPAREIPSDVLKKMEEAEGKRHKEVNGLTFAKPSTVYAKVVDQSGAPISDAKIVVVPGMGIATPSQNLEKRTDSDGSASFSRKWIDLSVTVSKPGYRNLLASSATFRYAKSAFTPPPSPDPSNPVLFVLQRM